MLGVDEEIVLRGGEGWSWFQTEKSVLGLWLLKVRSSVVLTDGCDWNTWAFVNMFCHFSTFEAMQITTSLSSFSVKSTISKT